MTTVGLYVANFSGGVGYLAVLDEYGKDSKPKAVLWKAGEPAYNVTLPQCYSLKDFDVKTVTTKETFDKYVRMFNPNFVTGVKKGLFQICPNYIAYSNGRQVRWQPHFEGSVGKEKFKKVANTLEYNYIQPITFTVAGEDETFYGELCETFTIDATSGELFWFYSIVENGCIVNYAWRYSHQKGQWEMQNNRSLPIAGYKNRKTRSKSEPAWNLMR